MTAVITPQFAENLLRTIDNPSQHPVHLLFNEFWQDVPSEVAAAYAHQFETDERLIAFVAEGYYAEPLTVDRLALSPADSLGAGLHAFITENGLEEKLATNYRVFHDALEASGMLAGMPDSLRYAILRGFQLHDYLHVITGYDSSPGGELSLQAFCLAQVQFPYFAMWVSVMTARMTFIDPAHIVGLMDTITAGWTLGRTVGNIQFEKWEERLDDPLADVRRDFGIDPVGQTALVATTV